MTIYTDYPWAKARRYRNTDGSISVELLILGEDTEVPDKIEISVAGKPAETLTLVDHE